MSDKNGSVPKEKYRAIMMFAERGDVPVSQKDRGSLKTVKTESSVKDVGKF